MELSTKIANSLQRLTVSTKKPISDAYVVSEYASDLAINGMIESR